MATELFPRKIKFEERMKSKNIFIINTLIGLIFAELKNSRNVEYKLSRIGATLWDKLSKLVKNNKIKEFTMVIMKVDHQIKLFWTYSELY